MRTIKPNKIIFSVFQFGYTTEANTDNHRTLMESLKIPSFETWGFYKGQPELSIVVTVSNYEKYNAWFDLILDIAKQFKQESILLVDSDDNADLYYVDTGMTKPLGVFQEASAVEAKKQDAYTFEPVSSRFFIVK